MIRYRKANESARPVPAYVSVIDSMLSKHPEIVAEKFPDYAPNTNADEHDLDVLDPD